MDRPIGSVVDSWIGTVQGDASSDKGEDDRVGDLIPDVHRRSWGDAMSQKETT